jgi:hypothetical protein
MAKVPYEIMRFLNQTLVYWGNPQDDGEGGFEFDAPIEIRGRCEYRTEIVRGEMNEELVSRARVYLDRYVDEGGYLYLGTLEDSTIGNTMHPNSTEEAMRILSLDKIPRLRGPGFLIKAFCNANKYGNN